MAKPPRFRTARLVLREWCDDDRSPFASLNADPGVMEHFPAVLDRNESDELFDLIQAHFAAHGFGLWATEYPGVASFIGFVGINRVPFEAPFTPAVEVGWRLARPHWGRGYATEAALAVVAYGFSDLDLDEIVSFTTPNNLRSRAVMERLGMTHDPADDFDHPRMAVNHPLRRHVLYRLRS